MKKLILIAVFTVFGITASNAQSFNAGVGAAIPVGDVDAAYGFGVALDFSYLFPINDVFHVGPSASVMHYFGKEIAGFEIDDATFIPIGGEARFYLEQFYFGANLGYGLGVSDGNDGGFYYRPGVGYMFTEMIGATASYSGIVQTETDPVTTLNPVNFGSTFNSVNLGVTFQF
jgi:hypothetical protein